MLSLHVLIPLFLGSFILIGFLNRCFFLSLQGKSIPLSLTPVNDLASLQKKKCSLVQREAAGWRRLLGNSVFILAEEGMCLEAYGWSVGDRFIGFLDLLRNKRTTLCYRTLYQCPYPVCITDKDGMIAYVNEALTFWLMRPRSHLLYKPFCTLFDEEKIPAWSDLFRTTHLFRTSQGQKEYGWVKTAFYDPKEENTVFYFQKAYLLPTFNQQDNILDAFPLPTLLLDENGSILQANPWAQSLVPKEAKILQEWLAEDYYTIFHERLRLLQQRKNAPDPLVVGIKNNDRSQFLAFLQPLSLYDHHMTFQLLMVLSPVRDLTASPPQKVDPQKLQVLGQLASGIVHDFNNLLTGIIGFCDLLLQRHSAKDASFKDIQQIKQSAMRAARLIQQLLNFSKSIPACQTTFSLKTCLQNIFPLVRKIIGPKVFLNLQDEKVPSTVLGDMDQIEQVLLNLSINARDAMPNGGSLSFALSQVRLTESLPVVKKLLPPGDYVTLSVKDSGTGILEKDLRRIFEPFFSTKDPGQGTGLGLANALRVMEECHGGLCVETASGQGTTFWLYFPCSHQEKTKSEPNAKHKISRVPSFMRILLVEDEDPIRLFTSRALREKGYEVLEARDGVQAMQVLQNQSDIHLIVTDVMMPGIDGPSLALAVKKTHPHIRILFVSGYPEDEVRAQLDRQLEKIYFLQKPFSLADFVSQIQRIFSQPEALS